MWSDCGVMMIMVMMVVTEDAHVMELILTCLKNHHDRFVDDYTHNADG